MAPLDKQKITEELEQLQLEETRDRVHRMRQERENTINRAKQRDRDLTESLKLQQAIQAECWHKKGGKGVENMLHGTDANYAVVKHTLSHGPTLVFCQRCSKVWEPPARLAKGATQEQRAEFKRQLEEYRWAMNLPTDNEPSGTVLFAFTEEPAA